MFQFQLKHFPLGVESQSIGEQIMHDEGFILSVFVLGVLGLVFYSLLLRYRRRELQHKERLAALEKGMPLPELHEERRAPWSPRRCRTAGQQPLPAPCPWSSDWPSRISCVQVDRAEL